MPGLRKILLAEDNTGLRELYKDFLVGHGYIVYEAADGNRALEVARKMIPELIFLDVMMPGLNGFEVALKLRRDPTYNSTKSKIVLLTNLGKDKIPADVVEVIDGYALKVAISLADLISIINSFGES